MHMDYGEIELQNVDLEKIRTSIKLHTPIEITSYTLPRNMETYIQQVMGTFLHECHQDHMTGYLNFCLGELLTNSKKANTKRIYFKLKGLDINNKEDYENGMVSFKADTLNNIEYYLSEQKIAGLYIKFSIQLGDDYIKVEIKNNSVLTPWEEERIKTKLENVETYKEEKDGFVNSLDQTEGAGLGIIIIILMLEKIGLTKENYKIFSTDTETITQIVLPLNTEVQSGIETGCLECVRSQSEIPVLEDALEELEEELNKPALDKKKITGIISRDVTLTCLLLKHVTIKETDCIKISTALDIIGFENLKKIYNRNNKELRVIKREEDIHQFWPHSYQSAFYAYNFVKNFDIDHQFDPEEMYIFSLLHCLESILLETASAENKKRLMDNFQEKGITPEDFALLKQDHCHGSSRCLVAQTWGLPVKLEKQLVLYREPEKIEEENKRFSYLLYLAEIFQYYKEERIAYYQINENALKEFNIDSEEKLQFIISRLEEAL